MRKGLRIWMTLGLVGMLGSGVPARADGIWEQQKITSGNWFKSGPRIWGLGSDTRVYWNDRRSGNGEVYVWDESGGERRVLGGDGISRGTWSAWQDRLAVGHYMGAGEYDLYLYDPVNGEQAISTAPGSQSDADIYSDIHGSTVVYEDTRNGYDNRQIYIWDPVNGERRLSPTNSAQSSPKIYGDTVVWSDARNSTWYETRWDVYMWNPRDGETRLTGGFSGGASSPAIYEDRIVTWAKDDYEPGLYEWSPQGGWRLLEEGSAYLPYYMEMWEDLVVWSSNEGGVGAWDPIHGRTVASQGVDTGMTPSIYGNKVAFTGITNNVWDIYVSTLVPEPSSLLALAGCAGGLFCLARRRFANRRK